ncbi:MAG: three-Cys-motif partner protein TcmP [Acidobacteriaceae bacterium]
MTDDELYVLDDGLPMNEKGVGSWSVEKYRLLASYIHQFASGTKKSWEHRTFIDLYSGFGYSRVKNGLILKGSPILALSARDPFNQYLFCEGDPTSLNILQTRVRRDYPMSNVKFFTGDCNLKVDEMIGSVPRRNSLTLCFVDPYNLSIQFETLAKLAARRVDLLCLLALHMDANRAYDIYMAQESSKVDSFLGTTEWKQAFIDAGRPRRDFPIFLAEFFAKRMSTLGFEETPTHSMHLVRTDDKNVPRYHLALFSKHQLAYKFWENARNSSTDQLKMFKDEPCR